MTKYLLQRLALFVPTLIGISLLIFLVLRIMPGDVAMAILSTSGGSEVSQQDVERLRRQLGLDRPLIVQYGEWMGGFLSLSWGKSLYTNEPITQYIGRHIPVTLELTALATVIALSLGIPSGVVSAIRPNSVLDYAVRAFSIGGLAIPNFWAATLLIIGLVLLFQWLPPLGFPRLFQDPLGNLQLMVWPALVLGYHFTAFLSRMTRSCILEVLGQDYVRTARAKGLFARTVIARHALRNALLPVVTLVGIQLTATLGGTVILESVFSLPGLGSGLIHAINTRDYPIVQTVIVLFAFLVLVVNLGVDLVYGWLDPRIRYA